MNRCLWLDRAIQSAAKPPPKVPRQGGRGEPGRLAPSENAITNSDPGKYNVEAASVALSTFAGDPGTNQISLRPMLANPFDKLALRIREDLRQAVQKEIQNYRWFEQEKGRDLSWAEACCEWTKAHRQDLGQFLKRDRTP
jgi:hypothetical protein